MDSHRVFNVLLSGAIALSVGWASDQSDADDGVVTADSLTFRRIYADSDRAQAVLNAFESIEDGRAIETGSRAGSQTFETGQALQVQPVSHPRFGFYGSSYRPYGFGFSFGYRRPYYGYSFYRPWYYGYGSYSPSYYGLGHYYRPYSYYHLRPYSYWGGYSFYRPYSYFGYSYPYSYGYGSTYPYYYGYGSTSPYYYGYGSAPYHCH